MKPYGIVSDLHFNNWSAFNTVEVFNGEPINSRLLGLIGEVERCAAEIKELGGDTMYVAGDVFHVRGSVSPSVLNPVKDMFRRITKTGIEVVVIAGNHDLEGKHSTRIGSAVTALEEGQVVVANEWMEHNKVILVPWIESIDELKGTIVGMNDKYDMTGYDLIIHAPIDGVIRGLPDHGLTDTWFSGLKFKRVFAGHYHNHKDFGNGVYSIGALAHHTWSDPGTKAGYLIVTEDEVLWRKSHLPEFVDLEAGMDETEARLMVEGNYVRAKIIASSGSAVEELRSTLLEWGAKGVVIQQIKTPSTARTGTIAASFSAGASIAVSISNYVKTSSFNHQDLVNIECQKVLAEAEV